MSPDSEAPNSNSHLEHSSSSSSASIHTELEVQGTLPDLPDQGKVNQMETRNAHSLFNEEAFRHLPLPRRSATLRWLTTTCFSRKADTGCGETDTDI